MVSVFTLHTLPLQWLLGSSESLQLDGATLELAAVLSDLLLGSTNGILVWSSSIGQTLHTHCRNDIQKDEYRLEITFAVSHQWLVYVPKQFVVLGILKSGEMKQSALVLMSWDTWPGLREPLGAYLTLKVSICQSVVWLSLLPLQSMTEPLLLQSAGHQTGKVILFAPFTAYIKSACRCTARLNL